MDKRKMKRLLGITLVGAIIVNIAYISFFRQRLGDKGYMLLYIAIQGCLFLAPLGGVLFEVRKWLQDKKCIWLGDLICTAYIATIIIGIAVLIAKQ